MKNVSLGYVFKIKGVMMPLTHHKYQFSHIGPGEVIQQLPYGPNILQHRSTDKIFRFILKVTLY